MLIVFPLDSKRATFQLATSLRAASLLFQCIPANVQPESGAEASRQPFCFIKELWRLCNHIEKCGIEEVSVPSFPLVRLAILFKRSLFSSRDSFKHQASTAKFKPFAKLSIPPPPKMQLNRYVSKGLCAFVGVPYKCLLVYNLLFLRIIAEGN